MDEMEPKEQKSLDDALVWAADGELEAVRELIAAGADVNGMPLIMAIQCDEPEIVQTFVDAGSDINILCRGTTPLIRAVTAIYPHIVRLLVTAGADVNRPDAKGQTPIVALKGQVRLNATQQEKDEIIKMLKDAGATE